jgi:hypothetical protein
MVRYPEPTTAIARRVAREAKTRGSWTSACETRRERAHPDGLAASALGSARARARASGAGEKLEDRFATSQSGETQNLPRAEMWLSKSAEMAD